MIEDCDLGFFLLKNWFNFYVLDMEFLCCCWVVIQFEDRVFWFV
jgi:hypothetical protein